LVTRNPLYCFAALDNSPETVPIYG